MRANAKRIGLAPAASPATIRCAIYTRKSTEEGLHQDFNTLDAQRASAEDFARSRRLEGWEILSERYDDGGFTGANTDRPALQRLLADIVADKIDCVIIYKIDRLSRSIKDFLAMVELLERHDVNLVVVTQPIDIKSSAGRMSMNILLTFAQFEREMISERTRDKMHAARRRGKWIGGNLLLGYDLASVGGPLVINEEEAARVREIFNFYLKFGALSAVLDELDRQEWRMKAWTTRDGKSRGGAPFRKNTLRKLLTNITYTGRIRFGGEVFKGEHAKIVGEDIWQRVQDLLTRPRTRERPSMPNRHGGLLKSLVCCGSCSAAMIHTVTPKESKVYRYYVCMRAQQRGWNRCATRSVSAPDLESAVIGQVRGFASRPEVLATVLQCLERERVPGTPMIEPEHVRRALLEFDPLWEQLTVKEKVRFLRALVAHVVYDGSSGEVTVGFHTEGIKQLCHTVEAGHERI